MKITFHIQYETQWGQRIVVIGERAELGACEVAQALRLDYLPGGRWRQSIELPDDVQQLSYRYLLVDDEHRIISEEWEHPHQLELTGYLADVAVYDYWRPAHHPENGLDNAAFRDVIFQGSSYAVKAPKFKSGQASLEFQLYAPRVKPGRQLCILGNIAELGGWNWSHPVLMGNSASPQWSVRIPAPKNNRIEYKYGIYDTHSREVLFLENGPNRVFHYDTVLSSPHTILSDLFFQHPTGPWKGAGLAIPVFSLRSRNSFGVGAFSDIRGLVDWARQVGLKMVQILPINDTSATGTWVDSYPYAAISVFALHPLYLDPAQLPGFEKAVDQEDYRQKQQGLNQLSQVDYEAVMQWKLELARQVFTQQKSAFLRSKAFKEFFKHHEHWLPAYALFCTLRDRYKTADFNKWGSDRIFSDKKLKAATNAKAANYDQIAFYYYLQYHLDKQLLEVTHYARQHQIVLKGDIPIGIYRFSVDAWTQPQLYHMDSQSGAPPDPFSALGQNWGFPTYNWVEMAKDGYQWWQNRLKTLSRYFDAFRIDHILGFFRIWQIPYEQVEGTLGYFNPAIPVTPQECQERGIDFAHERYCRPYITTELVKALFGEDATEIIDTYLDSTGNDRYQFKAAFATQRQVEDYLKSKKKPAILRSLLFKLLSNVLFIEDPKAPGEAFHPRIDLQQTYSFQQLDAHQQQLVNALYHDYFYHRQENFWREQAMTKLPAIKAATNMLICGEDLGMIPACVPEVMREMDLLTLEIQRMSKNPKTEFLQAADIPYLSVCSPSTHDMSPIRLWWEESEPEQIRRFYHQELQFGGEPPATCETWVAEKVILKHLQFPSMWAVFPMQDLLGIDAELRHPDPMAERINIPANPQHYWQYRLHLNLEDLIEAETFNTHLASLLQDTARA